jgi:DNA-binding NtrC family response regulator
MYDTTRLRGAHGRADGPCADPDEDGRGEVGSALESDLDDATVVACESVADVREGLSDHDVDCVVTGHDLPDGTGGDVAAEVRYSSPDTACVFFTGADREAIETAAFDGALVESVDRFRDLPCR